MTKFNGVTTSGNGMHVNENGGNRDSAEGKLDYTLLPIPALNRVVQHYVNGLKKYGRNNWHKLNTPADIERYEQSMFRHLIQYLERKKDEDHLAAVVWNALALLFFEETKQGEYVETKKKAINPGNNIHQIFSDILFAHFNGVPVYDYKKEYVNQEEMTYIAKQKHNTTINYFNGIKIVITNPMYDYFAIMIPGEKNKDGNLLSEKDIEIAAQDFCAGKFSLSIDNKRNIVESFISKVQYTASLGKTIPVGSWIVAFRKNLNKHFVCKKDDVYKSGVNTDKLRKTIEKMRREILLERENTIATIHDANLLEVNSKQHIKSTLTITVDIGCGENLLQVEKLLNGLSNDKSSIKAEIRFIKA